MSSVRNDKLSELKATYEVSFLNVKNPPLVVGKNYVQGHLCLVHLGSFYFFISKSITLEDACLSQILFDRNKSQLHLLNL